MALLLLRAAILQLALAAVAEQPGESGLDVSGLFQSGYQVRAQALEHVDNTPPSSLEGMDRSKLVTKLLSFLQGPRFHKSFQFLNNVSLAAQDLVRDIHSEVGSLKTGLNATTIHEKAAMDLVAKFMQKQHKAAEAFANATQAKLGLFLSNLSAEDNLWVEPLARPVVSRVREVVSPMLKNVELVSSAESAASVCHVALSMVDELDGIELLLRERIEPVFNQTASLLPTLEISSSKGRIKMLRRFADLGFSILEKVRSSLLAQRSLVPVLGKSLHCGSSMEAPAAPEGAAVLTQDKGLTSQAEVPAPLSEGPAEQPTVDTALASVPSQERAASMALVPHFFTVLALLAVACQG